MSDGDGIGSAGTTPVDPDNPLFDAVQAGGGFVEDEDGNVTGGPDGDGTARTEEERTSGGGGGSSGGSSGGGSSSGGGTTPSDPLSAGGASSSGGNSGSGGNGGSAQSAPANDPTDTFTADDPRDDMTGEEILYGEGSKVTNQNFDRVDSVDGTVVREETVRDVQTAALGDLNEQTGGEGKGFQPEDIQVQTTQRDGQTFLTAGLTDSGRDKAAEEQQRMAQEQAFQSLQSQTDQTLERDDVSFSAEDGTVTARFQPPQQQPDVTFGEANQALNRSAQEPSRAPSAEASSQIDRDVSTVENLTGFDVPGDGAVIPDIDPAREVENATGISLPDSAGSAFVSGVDAAGEAEVPFTSTSFENAGQFAQPVTDGIDGLRITSGQSEAEATRAVDEARDTRARQIGLDARVGVAQFLSDDPNQQVRQRVESRARRQNIEARQTEVRASPAPAIGRSPASGINLARGAVGIAGIAGGTFLASEGDIPAEERDSGELSAPEQAGGFASGEVGVPEDTGRSELDPTGATGDVQEVSVPNQGRDFGTLGAQQVQIGQQEQRERAEQREVEIPEDLGEPRQRGPSVRERQRREDLNPFERTFPTGGGAVVDGTGIDAARERAEEAQQSEATEPADTVTPGAGQSPIPGLGVEPQTDTRGQQVPRSDTVPGLDLGQQSGQVSAQVPGLATGTPTALGPGTATPAGFGTPTANAPGFGEPTVTQTGDGPSRRRPRRPDLPELPDADDDEEERPLFAGVAGTVENRFANPLTGRFDGEETGSPDANPGGESGETGSQIPGLSGLFGGSE